MYFALIPAKQRLREEVRAFTKTESAPEIVEESFCGYMLSPKAREFYRQVEARCWLTTTWRRQYGGLESSHVDQPLIAEELTYELLCLHWLAPGWLGRQFCASAARSTSGSGFRQSLGVISSSRSGILSPKPAPISRKIIAHRGLGLPR